MHSDGTALHITHLPSYWRVAPEPFTRQLSEETLVANISRGAFPVQVGETDRVLIHDLANKVARELVAKILEIPEFPSGTVNYLPEEEQTKRPRSTRRNIFGLKPQRGFKKIPP